MKKMVITILVIITCVIVGGLIFVNLPRFGSNPKGVRLERIEQSPNYKNGQFRNREETVTVTSDKGYLSAMWDFLFGKTERVTPDEPVPAVKTDLKSLPDDKDWLDRLYSGNVFQTRFPKDILPVPQDWIAKNYNLIKFSEMPYGGHFTAMEAPEPFAEALKSFDSQL